MAGKNLMSAIAGLSEAKADPNEAKENSQTKKKPKVVKLGKGGAYTVKEGKK